MQLDPETGVARRLAPYVGAYECVGTGRHTDVLWLVTSDGLVQSYNVTTREVNDTISVEMDLALCDPPYGPCVNDLHWSATRNAFVGMALGYPYNASTGHASSSYVIIASPYTTKPGAYGTTKVLLKMAVPVDGRLAIFEDAAAFDDASNTYFAVMSPVGVGSPRRISRAAATRTPSDQLLYAFDIASGTARTIPAAGQHMPFPFVVLPGGGAIIAFNPGPSNGTGLPNTTFVSVETATGIPTGIASGEHVPGLSSDNSLVLDEKRNLVFGIYMTIHANFLVALNLTSGHLGAPVQTTHVLRFPSLTK